MILRKLLQAGSILTIAALLAVFVAGSLPATKVQAYNTIQSCAGNTDTGADPATSPVCKTPQTDNNPLTGNGGTLQKVIDLLAMAGGIIAVIMIMINGVRFVVSGGNADKVASARDGVIYSVVGLVVIVLARSIIIFVLNKL